MNLFDRGNERMLAGSAALPPLSIDANAFTFLSATDVYANDVFSMFNERVFVMGGVRRDQTVRKTINFIGGAFPNRVELLSAPTAYRSPSATTHSLGAVWHLNAEKTLSLYGNLNTSFSPQFSLQPDGSPLEAESGKQKEVGLRFSFLRGRLTDADKLTSDVSVAFFGVNVSCTQCHNHPNVKDWTQDHLYGMKAFLIRMFDN